MVMEDPEIWRVSWEDDHRDYADFDSFQKASRFRDKLKNSISLKLLEFDYQKEDLKLNKVV